MLGQGARLAASPDGGYKLLVGGAVRLLFFAGSRRFRWPTSLKRRRCAAGVGRAELSCAYLDRAFRTSTLRPIERPGVAGLRSSPLRLTARVHEPLHPNGNQRYSHDERHSGHTSIPRVGRAMENARTVTPTHGADASRGHGSYAHKQLSGGDKQEQQPTGACGKWVHAWFRNACCSVQARGHLGCDPGCWPRREATPARRLTSPRLSTAERRGPQG